MNAGKRTFTYLPMMKSVACVLLQMKMYNSGTAFSFKSEKIPEIQRNTNA